MTVRPHDDDVADGAHWAQQAKRFVVVGLLNTAFGYSIFALLHLLGTGDVVAIVSATIVGALFNYFTIGALVFRSRGSNTVVRFAMCYMLVGAYNVAALKAVAAFGVAPLLGQLIVLPSVAVGSFLLNKLWVFRSQSV